MNSELWMYLPKGLVNHLFEHDNNSVCGINKDWYPAQWSEDKEGLNSRRKCRSCLKYRKT